MKKQKGFALLISVVATSILMLVAFVVINVSLKQLILSYSGQESQYAFYNAESGVECAMYWDVKNPTNPSISAFDSTVAGTITCNSQTISSGSQTVLTTPTQQSVVGGSSNPSIFMLNFTKGCVIVKVTKSGTSTTIDSRGYNTCVSGDLRRYERGVTVTY